MEYVRAHRPNSCCMLNIDCPLGGGENFIIGAHLIEIILIFVEPFDMRSQRSRIPN